MVKLDDWEKLCEEKKISKKLFLTTQTAEGLRVTLQSMIGIVFYLMEKFNFKSVLTGRINQDPVEVYILYE